MLVNNSNQIEVTSTFPVLLLPNSIMSNHCAFKYLMVLKITNFFFLLGGSEEPDRLQSIGWDSQTQLSTYACLVWIEYIFFKSSILRGDIPRTLPNILHSMSLINVTITLKIDTVMHIL